MPTWIMTRATLFAVFRPPAGGAFPPRVAGFFWAVPMILLLAACGQGPAADVRLSPRVAPEPAPAPASAVARPAPAIPAEGGAQGRLAALRDHVARLEGLIAAIKAGGVSTSEQADLARAQARLHGARVEIIAVAAQAAKARYRLEALAGGALRADPPPASR